VVVLLPTIPAVIGLSHVGLISSIETMLLFPFREMRLVCPLFDHKGIGQAFLCQRGGLCSTRDKECDKALFSYECS
jgi:hypothetical protein